MYAVELNPPIHLSKSRVRVFVGLLLEPGVIALMSMHATSSDRLRWVVTLRQALPLFAIFIAVTGSKLWLIQNFGSDVPFWDQWNAEGSLIYKPLLERGVGAVDWFSAHNEHRIFTARLTSALLLFINRQWDPLVQVCWEALCAGSIAALLAAIGSRLLPDKQYLGLFWSLAMLGIALPYGWENTLAGFQTPFYYLIFVSLLMFHLCSAGEILTVRRSVVICLLGVVCVVTLASGALTCLAATCSLFVRMALTEKPDWRRAISTSLVLIALTLIGFGTTPTVAAHAGLRAQDFSQAIVTFATVMGWPTELGALIWMPFVAWVIQTVRRRRIELPGLFVVGLAAYVVLNAAALAMARANSVHDYALDSRYTDVIWFGWIVNLFALLLLDDRNATIRRSTKFALVILYFLFAGTSLVSAGWLGTQGAMARGAMYAVESNNTRGYVTTGDFAALANKPLLQIPFPDAQLLRRYLDDPTIRSILPPGIRPGIINRTGVGLDALTRNGLVLTGVLPGTPPAPPPDLGYFYGTWDGREGNAHVVKYESPSIHAEGPYVRTLVSGYLGRPGLSLYLEDVASGQRVSLSPSEPPGGQWVVVKVAVPGPVYKVVAEDTARGEDGWFAFTDPVELGRFRGLAEHLISWGRSLTSFGLLLFIAGLALFPRFRAMTPDSA